MAKPESQPEAGQRIVTIYDQGKKRVVLTRAHTVSDTLDQADIDLASHDRVEPALESKYADETESYTVNIYRARPVMIIDGMNREQVLSPYSTPRDIATNADIDVRDEDKVSIEQSTNVLLDGQGSNLVIERATHITLVLYGKMTEVYTHAETVGELLDEKDLATEQDDRTSLARSAPITSGMTLEIWREGTQTITQEEEVAFETEEIKDADQPVGFREVRTAGEAGKRTVTYEITIRDGEEVERQEIASVETKAPVRQVVVVGAKVNYTGGPLSEEQITALGTCESGMTPTRNSGNGFYGAFQFMPSTWRSNAPEPFNQVLPHEAPLDAQKQAVQNLLSRASIFTQFPSCARQMQAQGIL